MSRPPCSPPRTTIPIAISTLNLSGVRIVLVHGADDIAIRRGTLIAMAVGDLADGVAGRGVFKTVRSLYRRLAASRAVC